MPARFIDRREPDLRLQCPRCGMPLSDSSESLRCGATAQPHIYPLVGDVPILINSGRSLFRNEDFAANAATTFKQSDTLAMRIGRWLPSPSRDVSMANCFQRVAALLAERPEDRRRVLVVGSGDGSASYQALAALDDCRILETDVSLAGRARIVCDASDLPFADASFDAVLCIAVLEHVLEPQRCVEEMHRVLCDDGIVYATTPFMQQVHMGEYDFMRFTRSGHRWLFRQFEELDSGLATGPASVLVWSVEYFLMAWTNSVALRRIAKALTRILMGWMTVLDTRLATRISALDGGGGFYFIGRRAQSVAVVARDMIGYYRGADDRK